MNELDKKYKMMIHTTFDLYHHQECTYYTLHEWKKGFFTKKYSWKPVRVDVFDGIGISRDPASGDYEWAESMAELYGISIPKANIFA